MRKCISLVLSAGLLIGGALLFAGADAADSAKVPDKARVPASADEARGPMLLDAVPMAAARKEKNPKRPELMPRVEEMQVGLEVLLHGKSLRTVEHLGKTYLPVPRVGAEYQIRVWNHGPRRIVAMVSVDGLSVINGEPASEAQPGYLVSPYSHILIKGWRRDLDTVAAFRFVDRDKSYANLVGKPENVGVIGLIAIEELAVRPLPRMEKQTGPAGKRAHAEVGSIGTEYGRDIDSRVYYVPFARSSNKRMITIYYDTVAELRKAGVPVNGRMPLPFPGDPPTFVPPPPGYKRGP